MPAPQPARHPSRAARQSGISFVKLLVALSLCATLAGLAVPSWRATAHTLRLRAIAGSFTAHVHLARSEAIKRNARVVLCKSASGRNCSVSGSWEQGWIVFHDANNNARTDAGEALLQTGLALDPEYRVMANGTLASYLSYSGVGLSRSARLRRQHHQHLAAFEARIGLDLGDLRHVILHAFEQVHAEFLVRHLAAAKAFFCAS